MEAKEKNDVGLLERSQLPNFEAKLEKFLTDPGTVELKVLATDRSGAEEI